MNLKKIIIILIAIALLGGVNIVINKNAASKVTYYEDSSNITKAISPNISTEGDKQIIEITAKGGYSPNKTTAKAGVPTIIRVKTNNTFDCSSALRIKSIGYSKNLPATGTTDIELPAQTSGSTLHALCSMGMYNFSIQFTS